MKPFLALCALSVLPLFASESAPSPAATAFETLKSLEGAWAEVDAETGRVSEQVLSTYRVTAGGHTVLETIFVDQPHEMLTLYHMDGEELVLTHYCVLGNAPSMKALPASGGGRIEFECDGEGGNMSEEDSHMHSASIVLDDEGHLSTTWRNFVDGKEDHAVSFHLGRVR